MRPRRVGPLVHLAVTLAGAVALALRWRQPGGRFLLTLAVAAVLVPAAGACDVRLADELVHERAPGAVVLCNPELVGAAARTYHGADGRVELGPAACLGVFLLQASPGERQRIVRLSAAAGRGFNLPAVVGLGALAVLHEREHAAGELREGCAETRALAELPAVLTRYAGELAGSALAAAQRYDAGLPAVYREPCQ
jgi:hypothetical protein